MNSGVVGIEDLVRVDKTTPVFWRRVSSSGYRARSFAARACGNLRAPRVPWRRPRQWLRRRLDNWFHLAPNAESARTRRFAGHARRQRNGLNAHRWLRGHSSIRTTTGLRRVGAASVSE
jgi:hypothetical protein